jgi:hypothetical protein
MRKRVSIQEPAPTRVYTRDALLSPEVTPRNPNLHGKAWTGERLATGVAMLIDRLPREQQRDAIRKVRDALEEMESGLSAGSTATTTDSRRRRLSVGTPTPVADINAANKAFYAAQPKIQGREFGKG